MRGLADISQEELEGAIGITHSAVTVALASAATTPINKKHKKRKRREERMPLINAATVAERVGAIAAAICPSALKSREATAEEAILLTNAAVVALAMNLVFDGYERQRFDLICQQICKIVMEDAEKKMEGLN